MVQQVICQLHCIWKNTNSCEFMGCSCALKVLMGVHGCSWMFMRAYGCSCVFVCFVVLFCLPSTFFELKRMNLRWRSQPWADFFLELSAIQGFEGAFFEISSGNSNFIKTNCQDWMVFHLSKAVVGKKKMKKVLVRIGCIHFFLQKTKRPIQPRLDQSLKGLQPSISENQHKD